MTLLVVVLLLAAPALSTHGGPTLHPSAAPSDLTVDPVPDEMHLSWQPPEPSPERDLSGYNLYRGPTAGNLSLHDTIPPNIPGSEVTYVDDNITRSTQYCYRVNATYHVSGGTSEGPGTDVVCRVSLDVPGPPTAFEADAGPEPGQITLGWDAPADDGGTNVTGYVVEARNASEDNATKVELGAGNRTHVDESLGANRSRSYRIRAINDVGPGTWTAWVNATTWSRPGPVTDLQAEPGPGAGQITLEWSPPVDTGGTNLTAYRIHRGRLVGPTPVVATVNATGNTTWTDTGRLANTSYRYRVGAVNPVGEGPREASVNATTFTSPGRPLVNATLGPGHRNVTLGWEVPIDDGGLPVFGYRIDRRTDQGSWKQVARVDGANRTYVDEDLPTGSTQEYRLTAVNEVGAGTPGLAGPVTIPAPPSAPQALEAAAGPSTGQITLDWTVPASEGPGIQGYDVLLVGTDDTTILASVGADATTYVDRGLDAGQERTYRVRATNALGPGSVSSPATATTWDVPSAPRNVEADRAGEKVQVRWDAPADDGDRNLTTYRIQHRATENGSWSVLGTVPAEGTTYVHRDAGDGAHRYRVVAINDVGPGNASLEAAVQATGPGAGSGGSGGGGGTTSSTSQPSEAGGTASGSAQARNQGLIAAMGPWPWLLLALGAAIVVGAAVIRRRDVDLDDLDVGAVVLQEAPPEAEPQKATAGAATDDPFAVTGTPGLDPYRKLLEDAARLGVRTGTLEARIDREDLDGFEATFAAAVGDWYDARDVADAEGTPAARAAATLRERRKRQLADVRDGSSPEGLGACRALLHRAKTFAGDREDLHRAIHALRTAREQVHTTATTFADADGRLAVPTADALWEAYEARVPDGVDDAWQAARAADELAAWAAAVDKAKDRIDAWRTDAERRWREASPDPRYADGLRAHWQALLARLLSRRSPDAVERVLPESRFDARLDAIAAFDGIGTSVGPVDDRLAEIEATLTGRGAPDALAAEAEVAGLARLVDALEAGDVDAAAIEASDRLGLQADRAALIDPREVRRIFEVTLPRVLGVPDRRAIDVHLADRSAAWIHRQPDRDAEEVLREVLAQKLDGASDELVAALATTLAASTPTREGAVTYDQALESALATELSRRPVATVDDLRRRLTGPDDGGRLRRLLDVLEAEGRIVRDGPLVGRPLDDAPDPDDLHRLERDLDRLADPETADRFLDLLLDEGDARDA